MSVEENKYMIIRRKFFLFPSMIKNSQKVKLIPAINQKRWGSIKRAEDTLRAHTPCHHFNEY